MAIAAHANSSNGLLQQGTGQYKIKLCDDERVCGLEFTSPKHVEEFRRGKVARYKAKPSVQGSDAHSRAEIGERRTFLKMDPPSLWGLKQALEDHDVRIRYSWNAAVISHPFITGFEANQGFFGGVKFAFHPSLTCLVGGRGTGKSTALELLRFAFGDLSSIEAVADDSSSKLEALLGEGGTVTVRYHDSDGTTKIVQREFQQEYDTDRIVKTEDGAESEILTPPVFFSQGELTQIAREPMAQLDLIDRYLDVGGEHEEERHVVRELRANASQLVKLRVQAESVDSDVSDRDTGLDATRKKYTQLEKTLSDPVMRDFPMWESEERYLDTADVQLAELETEMATFFDDVVTTDRVDAPDNDLPNVRSIEDVPAVFERAAMDFHAAKSKLSAQLKVRQSELAAIRKAWTPKFSARKAAYDAALSKAGADDVKKAQAQLRNLKKRLDELERKSRGQAATIKQVEQLEETRNALLERRSRTRKSRYNKRAAKASSWNQQFGGRIHVNIAEGADLSEYIEALRSVSKGALLRDPDLEAIAQRCSPSRVRELVDSGDSDALAAESGIKPENARKLVESAATKDPSELLDIESVLLPDVPAIRYEARPGTARSLAQLSVGQKATVLISLALVEGDSPLVIDQPEEPLDTLAITSPVVETLRGQKETRQFVFTTHNANVAVGADAELNIVLDASADRGRIRVSGGIDQPDTNELLVLHLEGGPEAIKRRVGKYRPPRN